MSRKRIVIDFDAPVPPGGPTSAGVHANRAKKSRRWRKVLGVLLVLVMIAAGGVVIGGYLLWRHYRATPAYSLSLMIDAAQRGDVAEFQKRLDDEAIAKNMVATVSQKASVRYGFALNDKTKQQIDSSMPAILQELKPAINAEVTKQIQAFAAQSKPRPFILLVLAVPSLMTITTEGDAAKASAKLSDRQFEIALQRSDDGWKVTDFKDDALVQRVVDQAMTKLPAIGQFDSLWPMVKPNKRSSRGK